MRQAWVAVWVLLWVLLAGPAVSEARAEVVRHADFPSAYVPPRHVDVWLPPGYRADSEPYAVLYAQDGQNLFNADIAFTGIDWGVDEALERLLEQGRVRKTIVVGIWNTPDRRREYLPYEMWERMVPADRDFVVRAVGGAPTSREYLSFVVEELKPFIDEHYRTRPGRDDTFLLGSSMGGLISLYGLMEHPAVFAGAACLSTHWPLHVELDNARNTDRFLDYLRATLGPPGKVRLYFDYGTTELDARYEPHQRKVDAVLRELGWEQGPHWVTRRFDGAGHAERHWRERVTIPLEFLLRP